MPLPQREEYTTEDIYNLPDGTKAELIDGQIYYMTPPTRKHQKIVGRLYFSNAHFLKYCMSEASLIQYRSVTSRI